jgi:DNA segregation ATPase FtsK/SpoIIIE-like protein
MSAPVLMTKPVVSWYADEVITTAIGHIQRHAAALREAHTRADDRDDWGSDIEARADYEAMSQNARELRGLLTALRGPEPGAAQIDRGEDGRGLLERAIDVTRQDGETCARALAKTLRIDAARAAQLLTQMERDGVITAANDAGWHQVRTC